MKMTYHEFIEFIKKHEKTRDEFKGNWFFFDPTNGAITIGMTPFSRYEIFDGYIPHYKNGSFIGFGTYDRVIVECPSVVPSFHDSVRDDDKIILTDVYDGNAKIITYPTYCHDPVVSTAMLELLTSRKHKRNPKSRVEWLARETDYSRFLCETVMTAPKKKIGFIERIWEGLNDHTRDV